MQISKIIYPNPNVTVKIMLYINVAGALYTVYINYVSIVIYEQNDSRFIRAAQHTQMLVVMNTVTYMDLWSSVRISQSNEFLIKKI